MESPLMAKKAEELKNKKKELSEIEQERKKLLGIKSEAESLKDRIKDRERQISKIQNESEELIKQVESLSEGLHFKSENEINENLERFAKQLKEKENLLENLNKKEIES